MRVFYGFDDLPVFVRPVVTVGSYDGVHAGHRVLIGHVVDQAHNIDGESIVITFSPHPRAVLGDGRMSLLNTLDEKIRLLEQVGIDNLIVADFTPEFASMSSSDFVRDYLVGKICVDTLAVGYNHHFGRGKEGNPDSLTALKKEFGFNVLEIPCQEIGDSKVSSTIIRRLVEAGDMTRAAMCLGYYYTAAGVLNSDGRLTDVDADKLIPGDGTYDVTIDNGEEKYAAQVEIVERHIRITDSRCADSGKKVAVIFDGRALKTFEKSLPLPK